MVGTLRPATDEELRISRSTGKGSKKEGGVGFDNAEVLREWIHEKVSSFKSVGTIGAVSAAIVISAVIIKRYGMGWTAQGQR